MNYIKSWSFQERQIVHLQLNDEDHLNALTETMGKELASCVAKLNLDPDLRCVIISGAGRAFSAGGDLHFLRERSVDTPHNNQKIMADFYSLFLSIRKLKVPIIAAVNGHAIGAGLCLALACDLAIVSKSAKVGVTFNALGLHPGMGATHMLSSLTNPMVAKWLLLTARIISGEVAASKGLFLESFEKENIMEEAEKLAREIACNAPLAVQSTLKSVKAFEQDMLARALIREADGQSQSYASSDLKLGIDAVTQKVKACFIGK